MAIEEVRRYFSKWGMEHLILEFDVSSATVELAAEALHCEPARIAKTMAFLVNGKAVLIVAAGDVRVDNVKFKALTGVKAKMISPDQVETLVGHGVGGVCPFGIREGVSVYLDRSLRRFTTVFPACGSSNSAIELTIPLLEQVTPHPVWTDVCKAM